MSEESTKHAYELIGLPFHLGGVLLQRARVSQEYVLIDVVTGAITPLPPAPGNTLPMVVTSQGIVPLTEYH